MLEIPINRVFKKKIHIKGSADRVCIDMRDNTKSTGYLIRLLMEKGYSVIFYGKNRDYYEYVHGMDIRYIATLSYKKIMEEYRFPIVEDCDERTLATVRSLFEEFEYENKYEYLNRKRAVIELKNPALFQSFYCIDATGSLKEKFICEAAFVNLIYSALDSSGQLHKLAVFIDMPYRPITAASLEVLNTSKAMDNIVFIPMYKGHYSVSDKNEYCLYSDDKKVFIKGPKKKFEVIDEQIFKE